MLNIIVYVVPIVAFAQINNIFIFRFRKSAKLLRFRMVVRTKKGASLFEKNVSISKKYEHLTPSRKRLRNQAVQIGVYFIIFDIKFVQKGGNYILWRLIER